MAELAPLREEEEGQSEPAKTLDDPLDFDVILPLVGEFGRYQKMLIWLICLPACIPCGFHAFNQLFMAGIPDSWCRVPELFDLNLTAAERQLLVSPKTTSLSGTEVFNKCQMFDIDYSNLETVFGDRNNATTVQCRSGYEYDKSVVTSSVVIDFDLVCEYSLYPTIALSALNIGGIIGVYFFGIVSDRYGRKNSFFICLTVVLVGGIFTGMAPNFWIWTLCRFTVGLTIPAIYQIPFIIGLELVGPRYRTFVTVLTCLFYTLGLILLCGVAYLIRDWVILSYATSVPFIVYYVYMIYLPESPRWLVSQGRFEEAAKTMKNMAIFNGKELPEGFNAKLKRQLMLQREASQLSSQQKQLGISDLLRTPNNRLKTMLLTFNWFANETVYVGLSYYGPAMGSDEYLSFFLSCLVEVPGYLLCWAVMDRWGRRWPLCLLLAFGGFACTATVLMPEEAVTSTLVLYLLAKFAISASFLILYPFAGELYPTEVRGLGIGFSSYLGGIGLVVIPFINYLGTEMLTLPLVIMGGLSVIGGIFGLRLPETLNQKLPQTLEEGEEFGKDFTMRDCCSLPTHTEPPHDEEIELTSAVQPDLTRHLPSENTPLRQEGVRRGTSFRKILVRQMSAMEVPFDNSTGAVKLHYWY